MTCSAKVVMNSPGAQRHSRYRVLEKFHPDGASACLRLSDISYRVLEKFHPRSGASACLRLCRRMDQTPPAPPVKPIGRHSDLALLVTLVLGGVSVAAFTFSHHHAHHSHSRLHADTRGQMLGNFRAELPRPPSVPSAPLEPLSRPPPRAAPHAPRAAHAVSRPLGAGPVCDDPATSRAAADLIYWRATHPRDLARATPYAEGRGHVPKYLTFEPDQGGFNKCARVRRVTDPQRALTALDPRLLALRPLATPQACAWRGRPSLCLRTRPGARSCFRRRRNGTYSTRTTRRRASAPSRPSPTSSRSTRSGAAVTVTQLGHQPSALRGGWRARGDRPTDE